MLIETVLLDQLDRFNAAWSTTVVLPGSRALVVDPSKKKTTSRTAQQVAAVCGDPNSEQAHAFSIRMCANHQNQWTDIQAPKSKEYT
mgnify:CR=1 FL=1